MTSAKRHIVLLGDSIFDNGHYVDEGNPGVIDQLKAKVHAYQWQATLLAVDGNVLSDVGNQIKKIPHGATHLFMSIGKTKVF
jgi:hypothetical protein